MKVSISLNQSELQKIVLDEAKKRVSVPDGDWPREWSVRFVNLGVNGDLVITAEVESDE